MTKHRLWLKARYCLLTRKLEIRHRAPPPRIKALSFRRWMDVGFSKELPLPYDSGDPHLSTSYTSADSPRQPSTANTIKGRENGVDKASIKYSREGLEVGWGTTAAGTLEASVRLPHKTSTLRPNARSTAPVLEGGRYRRPPQTDSTGGLI